MAKFHYPLKVQAEFDHEPVYIVDQDDKEVMCLQRSEDPSMDVVLAKQFVRQIEAMIVGTMKMGHA